jgi:hypothetical protein
MEINGGQPLCMENHIENIVMSPGSFFVLCELNGILDYQLMDLDFQGPKVHLE